MTNSNKRIQISRSKYIEESRSIAVLRLNTEYSFLKGEVVMINYYKDPDFRNNIGVLVAIGVKDGMGEDCYRIVNMGGEVPVRCVGVLPDVSSLVHGEVYVWYGHKGDDEDAWNYVYLKDGNRVIERVTGGPYIFLDLETGYRWFYSDQTCKREDDYFNKESIEALLQTISGTKPYVSLTSLSGTLFHVGDVKDILFEVKVTSSDNFDITKECLYYLDGKEIFLNEKNRFYLPAVNSDRNVIIEARQKVTPNVYVSGSGEVNIKFGYYFYYGRVGTDWTVEGSDSITSLENRTLHYRTNFTWDGFALEGQKVVMAYPKLYGFLSHIYDDHSMDYIHTYDVYDEDFYIGNVRYVVYVKKDYVDIVDFKQKFVFEDPDELSLEGSTMLDIITAWKVRNTFNGLVTLNEEGKIPEELYNINAASAFIPLAGIKEVAPESDMTRGEVYYIESTGKLLTALSDSTGTISDPVPGFVYTYNNDYYTWTGLSLRPFGRITTKDIIDITEIF